MNRVLSVMTCGVAAAAAVLAAPGPAAAAAPSPSTLRPGQSLSAGRTLRSADGRYVLGVTSGGRATLTTRTRTVWSTPAAGAGAALALRPNGNLVLTRDGRTRWQTDTRGAGPSLGLSIADGALVLLKKAGSVWTSTLGNGCRSASRAHELLVDISSQRAWFCSQNQQLLTTPVTTGAVDRGDSTPTGTWTIFAKQRNTTLYPASGGAYPVHYWMPYDGAYGLHDAPWQRFPYGSDRYRTNGSHGCVHVPETAMGWLYRWAPIGTTVRIRR